MTLYEIIIGNFGDDTNFSKLVLSFEPLDIDNININAIAGIDPNWSYISKVQKAEIIFNSWDQEETNQMENFINQLF